MLGVCLLLIISNKNDDLKSSLLMVAWSSFVIFRYTFRFNGKSYENWCPKNIYIENYSHFVGVVSNF